MAILTRSESLKQVSQTLQDDLGQGPDFPETNINTAPDQEQLIDPVTDVENKEFVKFPALQRTAISTDQYPNTFSQIQAYMGGHAIEVVYFSSLNFNVESRSNIVDSTFKKHNIHEAWIKIKKYTIHLTEGFQSSVNTDKANYTINVIARCYPGVITPKVGDYFIATAGDQREFLFMVSKVEPQSWRAMTAFQISGFVVKTLDKEEWDKLNDQTVQEYTFSLSNYAEGKQCLLTSDAAIGQDNLNKMRNVLASRYYQMFYDRSFDTLMRPDGYYDPYIVRFVNDLSDITVTKYRARQLFYAVDQSYYKTIYARLENNDSNDTTLLYSYIIPEYRRSVVTDAYITTLTGRGYLTMDYWDGSPPDGGPPYECRFPYVFSQGFYDGIVTDMSEFERFVYDVITTGKCPDYQTLYNVYLKRWQTLTPMEQFYRIPIYIWLIDQCLSTITTKTT